MRWKPVVFSAALSLVVAILVGCNDGDEDTRTVITVASINDNQPFFSDVLAQGDSVYDKSGVPITRDDYVVEDEVLLVIPAVPVHSGEHRCDSGYRNPPAVEKDNPFAVLEKLRTR